VSDSYVFGQLLDAAVAHVLWLYPRLHPLYSNTSLFMHACISPVALIAERFYSLGSSFYRNSDACMLVYDVTDKDTLDSLERWKQTFLSKTSGERGHDVPFVLLGNKCDLSPEEQVVSKEVGDAWAT